MGPRSRDLLARLTEADLSAAGFPYLTSREVWLASAPVRASRVTYVGELGWELYVPAEFAAGVYDALVEAGQDLGLAHAGYHAMDSLRIEKAYRSWGHDIGSEDTPLQAGLGFAVRLDKAAPFIGREALLALRDRPLSRRLLVFTLEDPEPLLYHDEPIWRDGALVGSITLRRLRPHARPRGGARLRRPPRRRHRRLHRERPLGAGDRRRAPARAGAAHASL